jgi:transposase
LGIDTAYYLVHSIGASGDWARTEQRDAQAFATSATSAGGERIVYLGGLGDDHDELSVHLTSRHAVGTRLRASGATVIELRAGVIIGSGLASFEMLRHLVDVLPVMVTPRWVETRCQPIAIADVITTLVAALEYSTAGTFELGGADVVSYAEMMERYAQLRELPKNIKSSIVNLVSPVPATFLLRRTYRSRKEVGQEVFDVFEAAGFLVPLEIDSEEVFDLGEASRILECSRHTIRTWIDAGKLERRALPRTTRGGRLGVTAASVCTLQDELTTRTASLSTLYTRAELCELLQILYISLHYLIKRLGIETQERSGSRQYHYDKTSVAQLRAALEVGKDVSGHCLSISDAAATLGINKETARRDAYAGRLTVDVEATAFCGATMITKESVEHLRELPHQEAGRGSSRVERSRGRHHDS